MHVQIFSIPVVGGEVHNKELNAFLSSRKILQVDKELVQIGQQAFWTFCITYLEGGEPPRPRAKIDYKAVLDEASFARFSRMRSIRKELAREEGVPAYAVFTNEELAALAKIPDLTASKMKSLKGIGEKKVEKYGQYFLGEPTTNDETSQ